MNSYEVSPYYTIVIEKKCSRDQFKMKIDQNLNECQSLWHESSRKKNTIYEMK